jgi:allantoinase
LNFFALKSRRVLLPSGEREATLVIQDGIITTIGKFDLEVECPIEDFGDQVIMPGLVDTHVHINEPGRTDWEGFETATQAAAAGGITTLVDMPLNCIPVTTSRSALDEKLRALEGKLWVDCGFWGGVVPDSIDELDDLLNAGVLGVKSFLIDSGIDEFPNVSVEDLRRARPIVAAHGLPYLIHAELPGAEVSESLPLSTYQDFLQSRPDKWELDAIDLIISEMAEHNCHMHIVHLSTAEALTRFSDAKKQGLNITVETCPHYLALASEDIDKNITLYKCCPPIRGEQNRDALWQGLRDGVINFIVSDHSPCTANLKLIDSDDIDSAWGGIAALQFGLPIVWTEASNRGFELKDISHLMSEATAKFVGLEGRKGKIKVGHDADLIVFDEACEYYISEAEIYHKNKFSPYVGKKVRGKVTRTYLRGTCIFANDNFLGSPLGETILRNQKKKPIIGKS